MSILLSLRASAADTSTGLLAFGGVYSFDEPRRVRLRFRAVIPQPLPSASKPLPPSIPEIITDHSGVLHFPLIGFLRDLRRLHADKGSLTGVAAGFTPTSMNLSPTPTSFEDTDNIYMTLRLYHNGSLMKHATPPHALHRARGPLTTGK
ncbi:hypothetical protein EV715DRAFT_296591 [Schizophyllum commune]